MTGRPHWGFYGRTEELAKLTEKLELDEPFDRRRFAVFHVSGRRGVGKSALVKRAMNMSTDDTPFVYLEIEEDWTADDCLDELIDRIEMKGLTVLLEDLPPRRHTQRVQSRLADIVGHLITKGAVVAIDEFQRCRPLKISGALKKMADGFKHMVPPKPPGKLVIMGSHEQRMQEMFERHADWHGRAEGTGRLEPWRVRTVLGIAAEQGLLDRPDRFLTLWAAYGGVPKLWERFMENRKRLDGYFSMDDDVWPYAFIAAEADILSDSSERFEASAYVEFERWGREAMLELGREKSGILDGRTLVSLLRKRLPERDRDGLTVDALEEELDLMHRRMGSVRPIREFLGPTGAATRWAVDDRYILFQIHVFPEIFRERRRGRDINLGEASDRLARIKVRALANLEGRALESFTAAWLRGRPDTAWASWGSWRHEFDADIDVTAMIDPPESSRLLLGTCKRSATWFDPDRDSGLFRKPLSAIRSVPGSLRREQGRDIPWEASGEAATVAANAWRDTPANVQWVAFCTAFDEASREKLANLGFETVDLSDMAAAHGYGPAASKDPEPFRAKDPEPDAGNR